MRDQRLAAALTGWTRCMRIRGFPYPSPEAARHAVYDAYMKASDRARVRRRELAIAAADRYCAERTDVYPELARAQRDAVRAMSSDERAAASGDREHACHRARARAPDRGDVPRLTRSLGQRAYLADTRDVITSVFKRALPAALTLAIALVPIAAGPADAASKRRKHKAKQTTTKTVTPKRATVKRTAPAATATPAVTPAPVAAPTFTSVISIGGYVFYNLTYAEAVEAYAAAVAAAPAGYTPPPVTSVSVTTTVGSTG